MNVTYQVNLLKDSDNDSYDSYKKEAAIITIDRDNVTIKLGSPEREIVISLTNLRKIVKMHDSGST